MYISLGTHSLQNHGKMPEPKTMEVAFILWFQRKTLFFLYLMISQHFANYKLLLSRIGTCRNENDRLTKSVLWLRKQVVSDRRPRWGGPKMIACDVWLHLDNFEDTTWKSSSCLVIFRYQISSQWYWNYQTLLAIVADLHTISGCMHFCWGQP